MMRQDKTRLVKFVKKVPSISGKLFQPPLLVWSYLSYLQDDFCKFCNSFIR